MAGAGVPVGVEEFDSSSPGPPGVDGPAREEGLAVLVSGALFGGRNSCALLEGRLPCLLEGRASALLVGRYQKISTYAPKARDNTHLIPSSSVRG